MCAFLKLLTFPSNVLTQSLNLPWCILFNILNVDYAKPSVRGVIYVKYISLECEGLSGLNFFGREYLSTFRVIFVHLQCQYVEVGHVDCGAGGGGGDICPPSTPRC